MSDATGLGTNGGTTRKTPRKVRARSGTRRTAGMKGGTEAKPATIPNGATPAARRATLAWAGAEPCKPLLDLVQLLPPVGSKLSKEQRVGFMKAAEGIFDFSYQPDVKAA